MTVLRLVQLALSVSVVAYATWRVWALLMRAPAALAPVRSALAAARDSDRGPSHRALGERLAPTWLGRTLLAYATARETGAGPAAERLALEELLVDLRAEASVGLLPLRVAVTASSTLGLMLAIVALARSHEPLPGLLALDRTLGPRLAIEAALGHATLGITTAVVAFRARSALLRAGRALLRDAETLAADLVDDTVG